MELVSLEAGELLGPTAQSVARDPATWVSPGSWQAVPTLWPHPRSSTGAQVTGGQCSKRSKSVFSNGTKVASEWQGVRVFAKPPGAGVQEFEGCWPRSEPPGPCGQPGLHCPSHPTQVMPGGKDVQKPL